MTENKILVEYFEKGMTYQELLRDLENFIQNGGGELPSEMDKEKFQFSKLNYHRYSRIQKTYHVSEGLKKIIMKIKSKQNWLVFTEHWCGDSAQVVPYVYKMAELNSNIQMKFLFRDENLDLMDFYLTDGKQSIPKIIAFDREGIELFQWGPRPKDAVKVFAKEKEAGLSKEEILSKLHLWYGRNKGKALEIEFGETFKKSID